MTGSLPFGARSASDGARRVAGYLMSSTVMLGHMSVDASDRPRSESRPPSWSPDWRRMICLGCGGRVVRARDGWVELGGNRSGSFLVVWGQEPLLSYATDPESFPDEPLFLFGVAHQRCVRAARIRLSDGTADLDDVLIPLEVERGPQVPPVPYKLHLPSEPTACPFCDTQVGLTEEHVWPEWYSRELRKLGVQLTGHGVRGNRIEITVPVCATCNNTWMSVLENDTRPVLMAMVDAAKAGNAPITLSLDHQVLLATWAVKTAYLIDVHRGPVVPRGFLHQLGLQRRPNDYTVVWVAGFTPDAAARAERRDLNFLTRSGEPTNNSPNAFAVTFTILNVLFQVLGNFNDSNFTVEDARDQYKPALFQIWPSPVENLRWPPAFGFSAISWNGLIDSINDAH
jgi:hypothetical protein